MPMEKRPFGRTGHMSSAVIFGAAALSRADQATADGVLDLLLQYDVNHIDTAARYGDSEVRIGAWMGRHRKRFFLATKTGERSKAGVREEFHRSLERLKTDHVDLIQLHALVHPDEWEQVFAPGGALEAVVEAREAGLARFIGVTGHGWTIAAMHRKSLERFDFDSILLPWNWHVANNEIYARDFRATVALCEQRNIAVQTIKALARGPWAAGAARNRTTWYQPIEDEAGIRTAAHWVLQRPKFFLNSAGDVNLLPILLKAAASREDAPSEAAMARFAAQAGLASIFGI
jgi:aryl-alcohol dehydrogenase-like predicted oxidoreductase